MTRRWVKMWVNECLGGTMRFDFSSAERGAWYDLILLAGSCRMEGVIGAGENKPYPDEYIAGILNIELTLLKITLEKCFTTGRIERNGSGYRILNWGKYQSEYERQKPYRTQKKLEEKPRDYTGGKLGHMVMTSKKDIMDRKKLRGDRK